MSDKYQFANRIVDEKGCFPLGNQSFVQQRPEDDSEENIEEFEAQSSGGSKNILT